MKTFKVKSNGKVYTVKANDAEAAVKLVKTAGNVTEKNLENSIKDFDTVYAASLAEELASVLRRGKLDLAKIIFEKLVHVFK